MTHTTKLIKNVKANLTDAEIHNLFINGLDDDMFAAIGASSVTIAEQKKIRDSGHHIGWSGTATNCCAAANVFEDE